MKKIIFVFLFTCACTCIHAQVNLVLNPSLEQYDTCPDYLHMIYRAQYWSGIDSISNPFLNCNPEYENICGANGYAVPNNGLFHHYCRTGNGMAAAEMYYDHPGVSYAHASRQYTQGRLNTQLVVGQSYCVTIYVALCTYSPYASNNIGIYFDNGAIDSFSGVTINGQPHYSDSVYGLAQMQYTPQVVDTTIISDSINWTKIQGSFIATGTERFITIGNFSSNANTSTQFLLNPADTSGFYLGGGEADYLIDDVSVIPSDALPNAGNDTTIYQNDSAFLGPPDSYQDALPYTWYILGQTEAPIDSGGGIWVHPDSTTTYVLQQTLCGANTYDTVTVTVIPVSVGNLSLNKVTIYPNPATNEVIISNAPQGSEVKIFNLIGQQVYETAIKNNRQTIDVSNLPNGSYLLQITASDGERSIQKIIIEK